MVLAVVAAIGADAGALGGFRDRAADSIFPRGSLADEVVVVGIDDTSLAAAGRPWPWPRGLQADLLDAIGDAGARAIAVDLLFAPAAEGDDDLVAAMEAGPPTVLAGVVAVDGADQGVLLASEATPPVGRLAQAAYAVGLATITPDPNDGVTRRVPLVIDVDRSLVPSLALAALAATEGADPTVTLRADGVQVGDRTIPTDEMYRLVISWPEGLTAEEGPLMVPAIDVLNGEIDPAALRDKVVFVGVTDPTLGDHHPTPLAKAVGQPGVLVQAAAFNTMATRAYLEPARTMSVAMWVFAVALIVGLAVQFLPLWAAAASAVMVAVASVGAGYLMAERGTIPNFVYPLIAIVLAVLLSGSLRYATETRRRLEVSRLFSQYVPEPVAEQLLDEGRVEAATAGQRLDVTVLFCDLRGFTSMASDLPPEEVNERLTLFYEYATTIVLDHGGTLMQYVGDEVFAIFGAPVPDDDHASQAEACARQLQEDVDRLDATLAVRQAPVLRFGIGLHSGEVVAAHAGSRWRRQYTVIGHTVNLGSRLCSQAGPGQVVLSDDVRTRIDESIAVTEIGGLALKGVDSEVVAWRLTLDREPSGTADRKRGTAES